MRRAVKAAGFTLIELLVVIGIIAILLGISLAALPSAIRHADSAGCASHMRGLALAFLQYATDNDGALPGRIQTGDKWPVLLLPYISDPKNYVDPGDPIACAVPVQNLASNSANNSSFFFNGFNDLGALRESKRHGHARQPEQSVEPHAAGAEDQRLNPVLHGFRGRQRERYPEQDRLFRRVQLRLRRWQCALHPARAIQRHRLAGESGLSNSRAIRRLLQDDAASCPGHGLQRGGGTRASPMRCSGRSWRRA